MTNQNVFGYEPQPGNARIDTLVEKLKSRLRNFAVLDKQGEFMGEVKNIILDNNRQINFVVSQSVNGQELGQFLLISKLVQKIDPANRSVLVDINKAASMNLPKYTDSQISGMELAATTPVTAATETGMQDSGAIEAAYSAAFAPESVTPTSNINIGSVDATEEIIRLLGERVVVDRNKRKVGEVIVRKEIETRMVQVPVRRERLIVEQIGEENKRLAEIDLGQQESGLELGDGQDAAQSATSFWSHSADELTVRGEFESPKIASLLLNAIALERRQGCKKLRVEIVVEDAERQKTYQEWFDRSSGKPGAEQ